MWGILGSYCDITPDSTTVEATKHSKYKGEIAKTLLSLGRAGFAADAEVFKGLADTLKSTITFQYQETVGQNPNDPSPKPIFASPNDRVVTTSSQFGGMNNTTDFSITELYGKTDHQAVKITPKVPVKNCISMNPDATPKFFVGDTDGDGSPDTACRVIELLEADPAGKLFKKLQP